MPKVYLVRIGDGNEGNFPCYLVTLKDDESPYAALHALLASRYIPGTGTRRHIMKHADIDGEAEYGIHATIYEGPKGEQAFESAWLTAELEPQEDAGEHYLDKGMQHCENLRDALDSAAWRFYRKLAAKG